MARRKFGGFISREEFIKAMERSLFPASRRQDTRMWANVGKAIEKQRKKFERGAKVCSKHNRHVWEGHHYNDLRQPRRMSFKPGAINEMERVFKWYWQCKRCGVRYGS